MTSVRQRQALGHGRVDLATAKQIEQHVQVLRNQSWWRKRSFWIR
ncbi:hypothetical protein ACWGQL_02995 [Streptomyces lydicus]